MNNYQISVSKGILTKDHHARIGPALWEFIWCLDKITRIDPQGFGWVLGGKPVLLLEIADQLGIHEMTVSRNLARLAKEKYIKVIRTPRGLSLRVVRAQKRFNRNVDSQELQANENVESLEKGINKNVESSNENVDSPNENVESNIDNTVDTTVDTTRGEIRPLNPFDDLTPGEFNRQFFLGRGEVYEFVMAELLSSIPYPRDKIEPHIRDFIGYWVEPTKSGKQRKWEKQETFEVKRRIGTWLRNVNKFSGNKGDQGKYNVGKV